MFNYKNILNDKKIKDIYSKIEEETNYVISHGIVHVKNVLKLAKNIANTMNLTNKEKHMLFIAVALHDVGRYIDNKTHQFTSEKFARDYLKDKLKQKDIEIVCYAIKNHSQESAEFDKMDNIAYCLILADKLDTSKKRLLKNLMHQANTPHFDRLKMCEDVKVYVKNHILTIEFSYNNAKLKDIVSELDKRGLSTLIAKFIKHFNLKTYKYTFVNKKTS